ncbi:MAG: FxsA family protein [Planctomycetes bacterium]|jgi:UPF0716 protein FxsA|nr:FxsA family protein [Planctomycetota bacterium]
MRRFGCLGILLVIALLTLEFYVLLIAMDLMKDILAPLLIMAVMTVIGVKLAQFHAKRLPQALLSGQGGGRLIALIGALLILIPGFITDVIGLILQIPLVQRLFSKVGMVLAASLVKRAMGGGFKGFPGGGFPGAGFPGGMPGGPFPGMKPDEHITTGKPGPKTYDVKPDKD